MHIPVKALKKHIPVLLKTETLRLFPFLFNLFKMRPSLGTIIITNRCNLRCVMCNQWAQKCGPELSTESWKGLLAQFKTIGIKEVHFTGGEPLLRDDLPELIAHTCKLGMTAGLTTNGYLLTRDLMARLTEAGISSMAVSIDAVGPEYEHLRGVAGSFDKVMKSLELLSLHTKSKKIKGYINFTLMKPSLPHFCDVKKLADSLGLPVAVCLLDDTPYFFNVKSNREKFWIGSDIDHEFKRFIDFLKAEKKRLPGSLVFAPSFAGYIQEYFKDTRQKNIPCAVSLWRVFIDPYGKVKGGCLAMGDFGDIGETGLRPILASEKFVRAHENMFYKRCPGCSCGYVFNLQHHLPSLIKERLG